jgi:hypothetical protein
MKRFSIILFVGIGLLLMGGCTAKSITDNTPTEAAIEATAQVTAVAEEPVLVETDTCVDCHTDKQRLIDTADPVEEEAGEGESEGVG